MAHAIHIIAAAMGVEPGPSSDCAVCGDSPFPEARASADVFGPNFVDYDRIHDSALGSVCAGCARVLGGKPSKTDPPLRMGHFAVVAGVLERPDGARLLELIRDPEGVEVIGWTKTRQRHASLRAEVRRGADLPIATEDEVVLWTQDDNALLDAVQLLRRSAAPDHILTGQYPPHVIAALGSDWELGEQVVNLYRPSGHLEIACALVRRPDNPTEAPPMPIAENEREAASLLLLLTAASPHRQKDGIGFWGALVPRRLAAAAQASQTLLDAASRLIEALQVSPTAADTVAGVRSIESYTPEEADAVLTIWRDKPRLVVAVARMIRSENT